MPLQALQTLHHPSPSTRPTPCRILPPPWNPPESGSGPASDPIAQFTVPKRARAHHKTEDVPAHVGKIPYLCRDPEGIDMHAVGAVAACDLAGVPSEMPAIDDNPPPPPTPPLLQSIKVRTPDTAHSALRFAHRWSQITRCWML
jgi:hypothetical protein